MNHVISSYFDDSHRGLQRQSPESPPRAFVGGASNVECLPQLRPDSSGCSPLTSPHHTENGGGWQQACGGLRLSSSAGNLSAELQAINGVREQRHKATQEDNVKLACKLRQTQEQLSITSAKKEAFRVQASRLEKEFKRGREQTDVIANELLVSKREAASCAKDCTDAVKMMNEMRKAHLQEVRLLQRGLEARGNDEKFRNRVNEVADLVDKLGRSVVQRDEAIRDKAKAETMNKKMMVDLHALADECSKLRRQNKSLEGRLKESVRRGKAASPARLDPACFEFDESDEEFETDLFTFENRFHILEEGPMGLDILASNLARDKRLLEKELTQELEAHRGSCASLEEWKALAAQKDGTITRQNEQIEEIMMARADLEEEIDRKRREVEEAVNTERSNLEARLAELQKEAQDARAEADSMVLASDKLSQELVKVHEQYDEAAQRKHAEKEEMARGLDEGPSKEEVARGLDEPAPEEDSDEWEMIEKLIGHEVKTHDSERPCVLDLEVWKEGRTGRFQLRARAPEAAESRIALTDAQVQGLDSGNPWVDLFNRVGLSGDPEDPASHIVISEFLSQQDATFTPNGGVVLCRVHRYDAWRYYVTGTSLATSFMADYVITKDDLVSDAELSSAIHQGVTGSELTPLLLGKMSFQEGEGFYLSA